MDQEVLGVPEDPCVDQEDPLEVRAVLEVRCVDLVVLCVGQAVLVDHNVVLGDHKGVLGVLGDLRGVLVDLGDLNEDQEDRCVGPEDLEVRWEELCKEDQMSDDGDRHKVVEEMIVDQSRNVVAGKINNSNRTATLVALCKAKTVRALAITGKIMDMVDHRITVEVSTTETIITGTRAEVTVTRTRDTVRAETGGKLRPVLVFNDLVCL